MSLNAASPLATPQPTAAPSGSVAEEADRRLDLFALPSETKGRFRMLVFAAILLAANLGYTSWDLTRGAADLARKRELLEAYGGPRKIDLKNPAELRAFQEAYKKLSKDIVQITAPRTLTPIPGLAFLGLLAWALYATHPLRLRWRRRPQLLDETQAPTVFADLRRCAEHLKIANLRIEWCPGFLNGQAYGRRGREALLLEGNPRFLEAIWQKSLLPRAVALHELAHVVNADAADREKAKSVWIAVLALLVVLMTLIVLGGAETGLAGIIWRALALILVIYGIWAGLIRSREISADWRVASWEMRRSLEETLKAPELGIPAIIRTANRRSTRILHQAVEVVRRLGRLHPSHAARHRALADPSRLFRISPDIPFVTGMLLALMVASTLAPLADLVTSLSSLSALALGSLPQEEDAAVSSLKLFVFHAMPAQLLGIAALVVLGSLLTGALGVQVQREAIADMDRDWRRWGYLRLLQPAFLLALGAEAGAVVSAASPLPALWGRPVMLGLWVLTFTFFTWLWLVSVRSATRLLVGLQIAETRPRSSSWVRASGSALLIILYGPLVVIRWSLMMSSGPLPPWIVGEAGPKEFYVFMVLMTPMMLSLFALALFLLWALAGLAVAAVALWQRRASCTLCGARSNGFAIGRFCRDCRKCLSPWIYAAAPADPGSAELPKGD